MILLRLSLSLDLLLVLVGFGDEGTGHAENVSVGVIAPSAVEREHDDPAVGFRVWPARLDAVDGRDKRAFLNRDLSPRALARFTLPGVDAPEGVRA